MNSIKPSTRTYTAYYDRWYMTVPFEERMRVKQLKAVWDTDRSRWYITVYHDHKKFARYNPTQPTKPSEETIAPRATKTMQATRPTDRFNPGRSGQGYLCVSCGTNVGNLKAKTLCNNCLPKGERRKPLPPGTHSQLNRLIRSQRRDEFRSGPKKQP